MAKCVSRTCAKFTFWISAAFLVVSIAILIIFPSLYKTILTKETTLNDGSLLTGIWRDIPLPLYEKLYFFNITNGDDFLANKAPMNVTQVGPYVYEGKWVKNYPMWNDNGTVSYRELRTYHFVKDMSSGSESDSVYTLNGPMIIAADILKGYNIALRIAASAFLGLEREKVIISKTIQELAYQGYKDPIIKLAPIIKPDIPFKNGIFSWLYGKNFSDDGIFTIFTGEDDHTMTGMINNWNGQEKLSFWKGDTCNEMNGTTIEIGPPLPKHPETYTFFQSIFCRSWTLNYTGDVEHYGVNTKRFVTTDQIFANGTENEANKCFEIEGEKPSGVMSVRPCQFGAPVLLSFPHFHMSDPSYLRNIEGLDPNNGEHGSHLDVEPITGVSVDVQVRFQVNLQLSRIRGLLQFDRVPEGVFPVFWAALEIQLTNDWAHFLKGQLNNPKIIVYTLLGIMVVVCTGLVIWSLVYLKKTSKGDDDDDPLIDVKEEHKENLSRRTINSEVNEVQSTRSDISVKKSDSHTDSYTQQAKQEESVTTVIET